jgi:hypothetical protein
MKSYRLDSVEITPTVGRIPVLVACGQADLDGVAMHVASDEEAQRLGRVREIGLYALSLFVNDWSAFKRKYGQIDDEDRSRLLGLLLLGKALTDKDSHVLDLAVKRLAVGPLSDFRRRVLGRQPGMKLGRELAKGLRAVEFILWIKDDGRDSTILPGLRCPDIRSAVYTLAVLSIERGGTGLGACVICGTPFVQKRKTRKTCSGACRYALHMRKKAMRSTRRLARKG